MNPLKVDIDKGRLEAVIDRQIQKPTSRQVEDLPRIGVAEPLRK